MLRFAVFPAALLLSLKVQLDDPFAVSPLAQSDTMAILFHENVAYKGSPLHMLQLKKASSYQVPI